MLLIRVFDRGKKEHCSTKERSEPNNENDVHPPKRGMDISRNLHSGPRFQIINFTNFSQTFCFPVDQFEKAKPDFNL